MSTNNRKSKLRRLHEEIERLRAENDTLRAAHPIMQSVETLVPMATRAFRTFESLYYDGKSHDLPNIDEPIDAEDDSDPFPSINVSCNLTAPKSHRWSATVACSVLLDIDDDEEAFDENDEDYEPIEDRVPFAFGFPSADPATAIASLKKALQCEPDSNGMYVLPEMRLEEDEDDDPPHESHNAATCPNCKHSVN